MLQLIEYASLAFLPLFLVVGLVHGHRLFDTPKHWKVRALVVSVLTVALSIAIATFWGSVFDGISLLPGDRLGTVVGAAVGILVYELLHYGYHRAAHTYEPLWRWAHQMHHSAESVDAFGANYLHPIDAFFFTTISSLVFFPLLGLTPMAGAIGAAFLAFNAVFQHANIRTPRWLGYLIQRPESHCVHHDRRVQQANFSDLPLWDIVFGTFQNPASFEGEAGFYRGASTRVADMLMGRDVTRPPRLATKPDFDAVPMDVPGAEVAQETAI